MVNKREEINKELQALKSSLQYYKPAQPKDVPYGYFEQLENNILQKTVKRKSSKIITLSVKRWSAAAASIMMAVAAYWWISDNRGPSNDQDIDSSDFVMEYLLDAESVDINTMSITDIDLMDIYAFDDLSKDDVASYLDVYIDDIERNLINDVIK